MSKRNNKAKVLLMVQFAILLAIEAIVCFTPLGSLPAIGPIVMTLSHIPVIITAIILGTGAGTAMGFAFGLFSFLVWTFMPPPMSAPFAFVFTPFYSFGEISGNFWSLVICFVPRILIGVVAGLIAKYFESHQKRKTSLGYALAAIFGSLTNTFLVLGGIYIFFGRSYAQALGTTFELLLGILGASILTSGIPEAILAAIIAVAVAAPVKKILAKQMLK